MTASVLIWFSEFLLSFVTPSTIEFFKRNNVVCTQLITLSVALQCLMWLIMASHMYLLC